MLSKYQIQKQVSEATFTKGSRLYSQQRVSHIYASKDAYTKLTEIEGTVEGDSWEPYEVYAYVNEDTGILFDSDCTCGKTFKNCPHTAALLLAYLDFKEQDSEPVSVSTSEEMSKLLLAMDTSPTDILKMHSIRLEPVLDFSNPKEIECSFRISQNTNKSYVVKDISQFVENLKNHSLYRYGKNLEFVHEVSAFAENYIPLVTFLKSIVNREDAYAKEYSFYSAYYSPSQVRRSMVLKGRYLDEFMEICQNIEVEVANTSYAGEDAPLIVRNSFPALHSTLTKANQGYILESDNFKFYQGNKFLYISLSDNTPILYKFPRTSEKLVTLLSFLSTSDPRQFLSEKDVSTFTKNVYPTLIKNVELNNQAAFDPYDYLPDKPVFQIYLDSLQEDMITCRLDAVYKEGTFNVFDTANKEGKRDLKEEAIMDAYVAKWFNSFDTIQKQMVLTNNEDKMFHFLNEGIPELQSKATVFVSDALKALSVRAAPKVSIGISVTKDNLLQLDMVADTLSQNEIADILAKYNPKKKFYRLKNGQFIDMQTSESFNEFMAMAKDLQLTSSQIKEGSASLPPYRAFYLNGLRDEQLQISYAGSFEERISRIHSISTKKYTLPSSIKATLRPYQAEGFRWLCALYENGFGALLADEMGLGKTIQVLTFLQKFHKDGKALVVCPASLVYNWYSEITHFAPELTCLQVIGTAAERKAILEDNDVDVYITSYDLLKRDIESYESKKFYVQIVDEAQYIKNANTQASQAVKAIQSSFHIALTGTPIENKLSELWSIFDFILPGYFYTYGYFRSTYEIPIIKEEDEQAQYHLQTMISPFVLRRLKKDVLKDLPDKLEEVYYAEATPSQKELYDARVQRMKQMINSASDKEFKQDKIRILAELTRLRQLCCNPSLIYEDYVNGSGKEDMCIDLIRRAVEGGHKILLFSQFTSMLDLLCKRLEKEHIPFYLLVGSTPKAKRAQLVEQFQQDSVPVFCISLKAGGTGLNLTAADIVIHYDPWWNTAVENQASDRAHRIGQKNAVTIYRLILKDTIEERILALQQEKSGLASRFLDNESISSSSLSREDLLKLLD